MVGNVGTAVEQNCAPGRPEGFRTFAVQLLVLAEDLGTGAAASDAAAVKTAIGKIGDTCDACHSAYR
jgi:cytochrome c556